MATNRTKSNTTASEPVNLHYIAEPLRPLAVPVDSLNLDNANARKHGEPNIDGIMASYRVYGQRKPIVYNVRGNVVEAGNGQLTAARRLGWTHIAAVPVDDDPATAAGFAVADNRIAELAEWGQAELSALLEDLTTGDDVLDKMLADLADEQGLAGETEVELKELAVRPPPKMTWVLLGIPTVRFGDIAADVERIAALPDTICETTVNDGERR